MSSRVITQAVTLITGFVIMFFVFVAVLDPLSAQIVGMGVSNPGQVTGIQDALVKYSVPVFLGAVLLWAVLLILRRERQTVR